MAIKCCCGYRCEGLEAYESHRETCAEFQAPFACKCGFTCGTALAFERHRSKCAGAAPKSVDSKPQHASSVNGKRAENAASYEVRLVLLGFDRAGKTTLIKKLFCENDDGVYRATAGSNMKSHAPAGDPPLKLLLTEVGGRKETRAHWKHFLTRIDGLVYVLRIDGDASWEDSCSELCRLLSDETLLDAPLLLFINMAKDRRDALGFSQQEVETRIKHAVNKGRQREWHVQKCCAPSGDGLQDGVTWIESKLIAAGRLPQERTLFPL
eukprot:TRINITY_DN39087_c0_g1_i1.p1 TRINITY_DN39087_c0_g1~~TRINITY_DN39087_c0_g1_i1.p1  ORF type:complete len:267 (-),score=34.90 TRINITY_DN39087_c0_g1_i1:26-826(-)